MIAIQVIISGRVQGVGFRAWVQTEAERQGLNGWVRNRHDGSVAAQFEGAEAAVHAMVAQCRQGPRSARVESVTESLVEPSGARGLVVLTTA